MVIPSDDENNYNDEADDNVADEASRAWPVEVKQHQMLTNDPSICCS